MSSENHADIAHVDSAPVVARDVAEKSAADHFDGPVWLPDGKGDWTRNRSRPVWSKMLVLNAWTAIYHKAEKSVLGITDRRTISMARTVRDKGGVIISLEQPSARWLYVSAS
jgi:hypothetical protein